MSLAGWYYMQSERLLELSYEWLRNARRARQDGRQVLASQCVMYARDRLHGSLQFLSRAKELESIA